MTSGFTNAVDNIKQRLRDFSAADSSAPDLVWEAGAIRGSVDRNLFPVPNLILFVLHGLCSFPLGYRGDKTHWIVPFTYRGLNCAISHEKLGVRLYIAKDGNVNINRNELLGKLRCRIPSDHIPIRSWPLFLARDLMRGLIETLKAEQST